jgi:hypothetical protein
MLLKIIAMLKLLLFAFLLTVNPASSRNDPKNDPRNNGDLALWIDEKQVKMFSGMLI